MPRKKTKATEATTIEPTGGAATVAEPEPQAASRPAWATALISSWNPQPLSQNAMEGSASRPAYIDGPPVDEAGTITRGNETAQGRSMTAKDIAPKANDRIASELRNRMATNSGGETNVPVVEERGKNWGDPYKSIVTTQAFEMGENGRFKQRVFKFSEKPADDVIASLKDAGFTYRAVEKAWTITANPDTRKLSDELAQQFRGPGQAMEALMKRSAQAWGRVMFPANFRLNGAA